jgi:transcriptional regulator with XRE-family HTH domain
VWNVYDPKQMTAKHPRTPLETACQLAQLGAQLRAARKAQKVSAVALAEASGLSRLTLHRIERGEPGVAMGHWMAVAAALGLQLGVLAPAQGAAAALPQAIVLDEYPALRQLAWQTPGISELDPAAALALYERNWRQVDVAALTTRERELIRQLTQALGHGRLLV